MRVLFWFNVGAAAFNVVAVINDCIKGLWPLAILNGGAALFSCFVAWRIRSCS